MKVWSQIFFLKGDRVRKLRVIEVKMNILENCHVFHFLKVQVGINSKTKRKLSFWIQNKNCNTHTVH